MKLKISWYIALVLIIVACRPTELLQEGKTKYYKGDKISNLAVVAYPGQLLDVKVFEDAVVSKLSSKKVKVTPAYEVFEGKNEVPGDAQSMRKTLTDLGYEGIVEIKLVSIRNIQISTEADYPTNREYRIMDVANLDKLVQEYGKREEKGATFEDVKVKVDVRVVDLKQEEPQVVWSARTESTNPRSTKNVAYHSAGTAIKSLKKESILGS